MNQLNTQDLVLLTNGQAVASTAVIAKGTENTHESVIRLVRTYQADLEEFGGVRFEIEPFETAGGTQRREIALLNEQQSALILTYMRNNDIVRTFKKRLIKAFWELAAQRHSNPIQVLNDPAAMRGLLLTYSEKVIALESKLDAQAPKIEALNRIATANGAMCITNAAKTLQLRPKELFGWLQTNRWIYRRQGNAGWLAYQDKLQTHVLQHKVVTVQRSDGSEKVTEQVLVTAKGLTRLSEHLSLH
jgi:phage antirepressor YoqD-like protein